jgi:predicted RNase H-like nuclease (RuvC/YqgF family)
VQAAQISDNPTDANSHTQISGSTMIAVGTTEPKRRQRKSQYSTLSAEVNSALSTIYRELESVADLRAQITELTSTNIQLKQDLVVMDQRHTATQRMLMALRAKTMASETTNEDVNALRTKIASLEAELQASREETAAAKELKERLAQLLSN